MVWLKELYSWFLWMKILKLMKRIQYDKRTNAPNTSKIIPKKILHFIKSVKLVAESTIAISQITTIEYATKQLIRVLLKQLFFVYSEA